MRATQLVLQVEAEFARSSFFDRKSKRHLGGPHSRAMTGLFVILPDRNVRQALT
jgi:hypothetical protein